MTHSNPYLTVGPGRQGAGRDGGTNGNMALANVTRKSGARWWVPNEDEWYKAAYHKNDGVTGDYWDYPTGTNEVPNNNSPSRMEWHQGAVL